MIRRYPIGAELAPGGGVDFRVWAPRRETIEVIFDGGRAVPLAREPDGHHSGFAPQVGAGARYRFRLDGRDCFPDPASRFQPEGPHGPSQVINPAEYQWHDRGWRGIHLQGQVIYEMHTGTFTQEGTFEAAARELAELKRVGITAIEVMPIADFPGRFGWGYDGVGLFAPVAIYGQPDDFRGFVDQAHTLGLGVILDVVYNHVGPDGNYLGQYSEHYFTRLYQNDWGEAINYDGEESSGVREWVTTNAAYWIDEYHLDGLRLDAAQQIYDQSPENILASITKAARKAAGDRSIIVTAENERQLAQLARPTAAGGCGLDAVWNDDFHHAARVAATGHNEAYYSGYQGKPQEFISALKHGFLYQGQLYQWQKQRRGSSSFDLDPAQFVIFIQNHDQVANSGSSQRLHQITSPGRFRALSTLLLLAPGTPLLFQGQEFAASAPFFFFADHNPELANLVRKGRAEFMAQFPSVAQPEMRERLADPGDCATFARCKLDFREREQHRETYRLYEDLLRLRREDAVFRMQRRGGLDGAVLADECFLLRYFGENNEDRLVLINLGADLRLASPPEPLLAPPADRIWELLWSSEDPRYGGEGTPPIEIEAGWQIPGHAALVMSPAAP